MRTKQVFIGAENRRIAEARFIPPPGDVLRAGCQAWLQWVHGWASRPLHLLISMALAHYQFETLHPFTDGNG